MKYQITKLEVRQRTESSEMNNRSRVYIEHEKESIAENLLTRFSRDVSAYKTQVVPILCQILNLTSRDFSWSQKAGCSCGCSPGFRLASRGYDVFMTVRGSGKE